MSELFTVEAKERRRMSYQLLLDTSSLMYRAFFALPPSIADQAGQPINAVQLGRILAGSHRLCYD